MIGRDHPSLKSIASLLEEHSTVWHGNSAFDKLAENAEADFFLFDEDQVRPWVDGERRHVLVPCFSMLTLPLIAFVDTLQHETLLLASAPSEIVDHLAASRPRQVRDRAWLVMFYSVALGVASTASPSDESTKVKLRSNLWLAFNDARLLLEPSVTSIQALVIMACHAEEFMTPSLCWSLITKACIMLQALGITHWRLDAPTRERRILVFWRLNIMDKALALILGRPPTFHREWPMSPPYRRWASSYLPTPAVVPLTSRRCSMRIIRIKCACCRASWRIFGIAYTCKALRMPTFTLLKKTWNHGIARQQRYLALLRILDSLVVIK